jgi:SAM-dependent methyltransferase
MTDELTPRAECAPDAAAIAKAHAIYTPVMLSVYDLLVHGLSNRFAWRCPTRRLLDLYRAHLSTDHLEAGVGTGFFLDRASAARFGRLALVDINRHCLDRAGRRLARFDPTLHQANLLAPVELDAPPFASVGLTYVLHCLPGRMSEKLTAVDHLRPLMGNGAVLFGATILGRGVAANRAARALLDLYNAKGVFNNRDDDLASLSEGLRRRFDTVEIEQEGCVALFRAA